MRRSTPYTAADDDQLRREQRLFLLRVPDALIGRTKLSVADLHLPKMNSERLLAEAGLRALVRDRMQDQTELVKRVSSQAEFDAR